MLIVNCKFELSSSEAFTSFRNFDLKLLLNVLVAVKKKTLYLGKFELDRILHEKYLPWIIVTNSFKRGICSHLLAGFFRFVHEIQFIQ